MCELLRERKMTRRRIVDSQDCSHGYKVGLTSQVAVNAQSYLLLSDICHSSSITMGCGDGPRCSGCWSVLGEHRSFVFFFYFSGNLKSSQY